MTGEPSASWPELSPVERETVLLASIVAIIADLVNRGLFAVHPYGTGSQIQFKTSSDQRIFSILLVDFLSGTDGRGPVPKVTFLGALDEITRTPQFDVNGSGAVLRVATDAFSQWLAEAPPIDVWFPTIFFRNVKKATHVALPHLTAPHAVVSLEAMSKMNASASRVPPTGRTQARAVTLGITTITATDITRPVRPVVFV